MGQDVSLTLPRIWTRCLPDALDGDNVAWANIHVAKRVYEDCCRAILLEGWGCTLTESSDSSTKQRCCNGGVQTIWDSYDSFGPQSHILSITSVP